MDDLVKAALNKWPNVPHCYGWLALDSRGQWWMRDERAQAAGPFACNLASKGTMIRHDKLLAFIARNYEADAQGQWFFQNGPQRVYVELELTPWVWRLDAAATLRSHTGLECQAVASYLDEEGRLFISSSQGLGLVHSQDMVYALEALEAGLLPAPVECLLDDLLRECKVVRSPQQSQHRQA